MQVEKVNYTIRIENEGQVIINLDRDYKGNIKINVKGVEGVLNIPVQLSKNSIDKLKKAGIEIHEHCGLLISL